VRCSLRLKSVMCVMGGCLTNRLAGGCFHLSPDQGGDKRDDISAYGLRAFRLSPSVSSCLDSPRPVFRWCGVFQVVKTAQSRGRTGRTLLTAFRNSSGATRLARCGFRFGLRRLEAGFSSRCWLSPLFYEDAQIFIFPAPISCLGDRHLRAAGDAFG
jgi:hypothetical protein